MKFILKTILFTVMISTNVFGAIDIFQATKTGNEKIVKLLIKKSKGEALFKMKDGLTIYDYAIQQNQKGVLKTLIEESKNLNIVNQRGKTPLYSVMQKLYYDKGYYVHFEAMIEKGANINKMANGKYATNENIPVLFAIDRDLDKAFNFLVDKGANLNVYYKKSFKQGSQSLSPLIYSLKDKETFYKVLKKVNYDVNEIISKRETLIYKAIRFNDAELVKTLIEKGAKVNIVNISGKTPLNYALGNSKIVKLLVDAGINIDVLDNYGSSSMLKASKKGYWNSFIVLAKAGADVNVMDDRTGDLPIHYASRDNNTKAVEIITLKGMGKGESKNMYINIEDSKGKTPLYYLKKQGNIKATKIILKYGDFSE